MALPSRYSTRSSPSSSSGLSALESFPSLSSFALGSGHDDGDDGDDEEEEDGTATTARRYTTNRSKKSYCPSGSEDEYTDSDDDGGGNHGSLGSRRPAITLLSDDQDEDDDNSDDDDLWRVERLEEGEEAEEEDIDISMEADADEDEPSERDYRRHRQPLSMSRPPSLPPRSPRKAVAAREHDPSSGATRERRPITPSTSSSTTLTLTDPSTAFPLAPAQQQLRQDRHRHFHACFVCVDPPLLRALTHLELSSVNLKRTDLQSFTQHLFLLTALRSISLADNQLDDSCTKEIRTVLCLDGLHHVDLSRNLLGRGTARMIADRLKHRLALRTLDVAGNRWFFAFDDATEVARALALGLAANTSIVDFRISLPVPQPHLERDRFVLPQQSSSVSQQQQQDKSMQRNRKSLSGRERDTPAEAFTRELALEFANDQRQKSGRALLSLGLVHAELSRRAVIHLMKLANHLLVLDLSFAFAGIAAAQVIATALKMKEYATLTQLNVCGNRFKSMGVRSLCKALHTNSRLTSLNVSRNDLRKDLLPDLAAMLAVGRNQTLVEFDLTKNDELFHEVHDKDNDWQSLTAALARHPAIRSLGDLKRIPSSPAQRNAFQKLFDTKRQRSDVSVLAAVQERSMAKEEEEQEKTQTTPVVKMWTVTISSGDNQQGKTIWRQRSAIHRQARVSVMWKMKAFAAAAARPQHSKRPSRASSSFTEHPQETEQNQQICIVWRVFVHRKCDFSTTAQDVEAASGSMGLHSGLEFFSALVYCDEDDRLSIVVGMDDQEDDDDDEMATIKVVAKDVVVVARPLKDCLDTDTYYYNAEERDQAVVPSLIQWQPQTRRQPAKDPSTHSAELKSVYMRRTGLYRVVWRVRVGSEPASNSGSSEQKSSAEFWEKSFTWHVARRHCWEDSESQAAIKEVRLVGGAARQKQTDSYVQDIGQGSSRDFQAVVRNQRDFVVCTQPVELLAGEILHVRVSTSCVDAALQLIEFHVLPDENPPLTC